MQSRIAEEHNSGAEAQSKSSYLAGASPNASALVALTVVADVHDVMAVLRTAALLSRSFKTKLSIEISGLEALLIDPLNRDCPESVKDVLDRAETHLSGLISSNTHCFMLEAEMTTASFLTIGDIRVRVHMGSLSGKARGT